jgi:hypothetical protein
MAKGIIDSGISFGLQNFLFIDSDESDGTYNYVSYMTKKGSILIGRYKKDDSEGRYWLGSGTYATVWAGRATYTYLLPTQLEYPKA